MFVPELSLDKINVFNYIMRRTLLLIYCGASPAPPKRLHVKMCDTMRLASANH